MILTAFFVSASMMIGALVGSVIHEASHAVAAELVGGSFEGVGWNNDLGGPAVYYESPAGWQNYVVSMAPLPVAVLIAGIAAFAGPRTVGFAAFTLGVVAMTAKLSRSDLSVSRQADLAVVNE